MSTSKPSADWLAGVNAEQQARDEGLSSDAKSIRGLFESLSRIGHSSWDALSSTAVITACEQPLRKRAKLAWRIIWRS